MKNSAFIEEYIKGAISLNRTRFELLKDRLKTINAFLINKSNEGVTLGNFIPQGSFARKTIIKPSNGNEFDADVLIPMNTRFGWTPRDYIQHIYDSLSSSDNYKDKIIIQKRCVTLTYADDFHIDILPYVTKENGKKYIANKEKDQWELHDPSYYNRTFNALNKRHSGKLVTTIKFIKFVREVKDVNIPSFILSSIILNALNKDDSTKHQNIADYINWIFYKVSVWIENQNSNIYIDDYEGNNLIDRWGVENFFEFAKEWKVLEKDFQVFSSIAYDFDYNSWKGYLEFFVLKTTDVCRPYQSGIIPGKKLLEKAPLEEFFDIKYSGIQQSINYRQANLVVKDSNKEGSIKDKILVKNQNLTFVIEGIDFRGDEKFFWKTRNSGIVAKDKRKERGQIKPSYSYIHKEPVEFTGKHWVEVWVVREERLISYAISSLDFINS